MDTQNSTPGEVAELLLTLIDGLEDREEGLLHAYVVLPEGSVDREFIDSVASAECARFPLTGRFGGKDGNGWRNEPFVFHLADSKLIGEFVGRFWGGDTFSVFFSPLGPLDFFAAVGRFDLLRQEGGSLVWAPYWYPKSFEKFLTDSEAQWTDMVFRRTAYYLAESDEGAAIRVYCRGDEDEEEEEA